jgi:hypothetical protein
MKELSEEPEIRLPEIADAACAYFLSDENFLKGPIADLIRLAAYDAAQRYAQHTRGVIPFGDSVITREEMTKRARRSQFSVWLEHVGDRHIRFMDLTREELLVAAGERRGRAQTDLDVALLEETLADALESGQHVKDRFTEEEIEEVRASLERQKSIKGDLLKRA